MKSYIILDLDNCISDDAWRLKYIDKECDDIFKKYHEYHSRCDEDKFKNQHLVNEHPDANHIIVITGRPLFYRELTLRWLVENGIIPVGLYMRDDYDNRPTAIIKLECFEKALSDLGLTRDNIICAYDDQPEIIKAYKEHSIDAKQFFINNPNQYGEPA